MQCGTIPFVSESKGIVDENPPESTPARLDSWKDIASYLKRDVSTVQRWEKREGMPVHRHLHDKAGSIYAFPAEIDAWWQNRQTRTNDGETAPTIGAPSLPAARARHVLWLAAAVVAVAIAGTVVWFLIHTEYFWKNPLSNAHFIRLTDFEGTEQAAAISRDGKFVAFLADRDGPVDVWLTHIGTGRFYNLTRGALHDLVNPSIRTLRFSPDGTSVSVWARTHTAARGAEINVWAIPTLGGEPRLYLERAAELDWSSDGTRLVYHTPGPGDPMFVKSGGRERQIFVAPSGLHSHFPIWSPDDAFIYFVCGAVPDAMDIWRIPSDGGSPERVTSHHSRVSHPAFVDRRTLIYLATASDGTGPWLYAIDVKHRRSRRVSYGVDSYTSLSASADGRRLVLTAANPVKTVWRVALTADAHGSSRADPLPLPTVHGRAPRFGKASELYVASRGGAEAIWKLTGGNGAELRSLGGGHIIGGPAVAPDGNHIAFSLEENGTKRMHVMNADGSADVTWPASLEPQGTPAWSPDGQSIAVAASCNGAPCLARLALGRQTFVPLVRGFAADPAWSPDGSFVVYSGPDVGTTFQIRAVTLDGRPRPMPNITLTRGVRRLLFLPGGNALIVAKGEMDHKNLWAIDLATGHERQLTNFGRDFLIRDFDISPDSREILVEREQVNSDIVLIDR